MDREQLRRIIDEALDKRTLLPPDSPSILTEAIRYSLLAPGKRLRPTLVLLASSLLGGSIQAALPVACAVEMIHCYSLIHDDLPAMDDDDLRRGRPTSHKKFGEAVAILAGDALLTLAFETIAQVQPPQKAGECVRLLASAAGPLGMVGGQTDDVRFATLSEKEQASERTLSFLEAIHRRKTSAMIRVSLTLGGVVADANQEQLGALARFGEAFGLAFQITDDLLDLLGDEKAVGKRLHKDNEAGKLTFPTFLGMGKSQEEARRQIHLANEALACFSPTEARDELKKLVDGLIHRTW